MISLARPHDLIRALRTTVVGQSAVVESLVLALVADGHLLLEGPPGVAKTLACRALAAAVGGTFRRIQFTPDLLPSDVVGTRIFDQRSATFSTVRGPIFANVVLADEINRAPAKVQSALLEGMQEHHATIGSETLPFPSPFIVLATMNPIDSDGTYALPLAQMDRFAMKVLVAYPSADDERTIVDRFGAAEPPLVRDAITLADVERWREEARRVHLSAAVRDYAIALVRATRNVNPYVELGASPRASLALAHLARARALLDERDYVSPDDVRDVAAAVLRHRIALTYRAATEGISADAIVAEAVAGITPP